MRNFLLVITILFVGLLIAFHLDKIASELSRISNLTPSSHGDNPIDFKEYPKIGFDIPNDNR
jgi:hypothetical protein